MRRLADAKKNGVREGDGHNSLFSFTDPEGGRFHITKPMATRALDKIWKACGYAGVSGHSFRVGGASLLKALGIPITQICLRGRWASDSYKLYLREFTEEDIESTNGLLRQLEEAWSS
ncbi:uncharacterized protein PGTG_13385 [Puccinia graminis f. sp. tritici CRL 75-36-700-3]|uniref:Tyr recombinase domain-containing protein n=1 Tax=Puccinia graminis f. sp. tritici (strain CRL 75-36-700-3 / race SCCL) TaxID=418459 RepID=E3KS91_PUCGT|nr:uncharacterized protein PGTG_13385 [Puccinia graminis f. sp. tritici CRL 75-36-700-3]EFP87166.1 hypothetical protein PGTG_13385 [Puccinia graminis f. sp. tritici CRL 75-36-700-3]